MTTLNVLARLRWAALVLLALALPAAWGQTITVYSDGNVAVGDSRKLTAYVPLTDPSVVWAVNGMAGGNASVGTVSSIGLYQAPAAVPSPNAVKVSATSTSVAGKSGFVTLTITQVPPHLWSSRPTAVRPGAFTLALNGSGFNSNASVSFGGVKLATTLVSATQITASGTATSTQLGSNVAVLVSQSGNGGTASETVQVMVSADAPAGDPSPGPGPGPGPAPDPGTSKGTANLKAGRFLEQAAFGPTPAAMARVNTIGIDAWLNEQFAMPETAISLPASSSTGAVQVEMLWRLSTAPDQLRQRVATALSQLIVISLNKNIYPNEVVPYLQILSADAFGNYRTLLGDIATSAQMGKYLDLANSNKPSGKAGANENFARELMQLFTLGLYKLNLDGSVQLDASGTPIATYDQAMVQQLALAFTGWTYVGPGNNNWENFSGPLQPKNINHDTSAKSLLGCSLAAGQSAAAEMVAALDCVFKHPNVAPFVSTRLIRALVTSNPSPAYVARVATVFNNNGSGVRGDLKLVVRAILLDAEARNDGYASTSPNSGKLKDPILHVVSLLRALSGGITPGNQLSWNFSRLGEAPLLPPSVFSFYSPLFRIPHSPLAGPEFQIYTPTEAVLRGNFIWALLNTPGTDVVLDVSPLVALGANTAGLIDAVDQALLYGRMPQAMRQSIANAIVAQSDNRQRALIALYLTTLSGYHAVQY